MRTGYPSPRFLLALIHGLPQGSLTSAMLQGSPELVGYSREVSLLADVFDAVSVNTVATSWGKRSKPFLWPGRPRVVEQGQGEATVPGDLDGLSALFARTVGG